MQKQSLVTVGITTYNHDKYIMDCLRSVLSQNYSNYIIIVCDDASTDNTQNLLIDFQSQYPDKIKLFLNKKNEGITNSINIVLQNATGEYFTAIGGDDLMYENQLSTQVDYLSRNSNCAMCFHDLDIINLETNELISTHRPPINSFCHKRPGTFIDALRDGCFFHCVGIMFRLGSDFNLAFDHRIPLASDWLFFVELLHQTGTADYIPSVLGAYGRTPNSITLNRPTDFKLEVDLLNSCNILLFKYPLFRKSILNRCSMIHFGMRIKDPLYYIDHVKFSLKISFKLKYLLIFCLYYLSLGIIKK
jgi:glycosyltransferase involved in cell wall biosynthesis